MSGFECKTKLPVQIDPLRLRSSVLQGASVLPSSISTLAYPVRSSIADSLLKKHQDLLSSARTLGTFSTTSAGFCTSKRGRLSQRGAPPVKKVKNTETTVTAKWSKVEKPLKRSEAAKAEPFSNTEAAVDKDDGLKEKFYSEISYDNKFEKMEVEEKWEYDYGFGSVYGELDDASQCKRSVVNLFNHTLVEPQDFRQKDLELRDVLLMHLDDLSQTDPEFVLKLSLYGRKHLNVRSTSNFLVAFAASDDRCKFFLPKYYSSVVILPSDWIEIAEFALTLGKGDKMVLPSSLRRVMAKKFPDFDKYQLAKYNKDKTKNQKRRGKKGKQEQVLSITTEKHVTKDARKKSKKWSDLFRPDTNSKGDVGKKASEMKDADQRQLEYKSKKVSSSMDTPRFTLKQLVRKLHISEPVDSVMEIVGKKYPETMEAFFQSRLPGLFEEERAGKRMKLPTPETWETQVSLKGNKGHVWEELLDHKKLPFMAMLRNLRNLIIAKVSDKHHDLVLGKLTNENAVINSKQFPFRFFSAYSVLDDLDKDQEDSNSKSKRVFRGRKLPVVKKYKRPKKAASVKNLKPLLSRYRSALDKAVKIATTYNVPPIPGRTLIFCDLSDEDSIRKNCASARSLGTKRSVGEMAVLLSLMCKYSCEESRLLVCGTRTFEEVRVDHKSSILENTKQVLQMEHFINSDEDDGFPYMNNIINKLVHSKEKIDRWIVMGGEDDRLVKTLSPKLSEFRQAVNPNIQAYHVDPSSSKTDAGRKDSSLGFVRLFGFTEQVLRYIAEESDKSQMTFVENIDRLYKLENPKHLNYLKVIQDIPMAMEDVIAKTPKWTSCRIFISSTFLDMFSERDLLVRYIFQELKVRARSLFVDIFEVDLRWGITEEQAQNNETIHLCLSEVMKCQFFIGMLGERYGWCPENYGGLSSYPGLEWIEKHPKGSSVTELEFRQCFRTLDVKSRAFFYFRDSQFLKDVPEKQKHLVTDNKEQQLKSLKKFVVNSGAEVYDNYPCQWGGIDGDGKARVVNLEEFGRRVLDNLWNAIQKAYSKNEVDESDSSLEENADKDLHISYADFLSSKFIGRQNLVNHLVDLLNTKNTGILLVTGKPGSGKSALMASVYKHWLGAGGNKKVLIHHVGASPGSDDVVRMMTRFSRELEGLCQFSAGVENASFEFSSKMFQECLKSASSDRSLKIQVFVDGVDGFSDEHQARLMSWLPQYIPKGVLFVVSTNENSETHVSLKNRPSLVGSIDVGVLSLSDRQAIIREKLKNYSKALDESAFNNQMKLISSKRESTSPLYLSLICEEMRQFGDFEKMNTKLASLPPTLSKLMQSFIEDFERRHGELFTRTALCCLVYSKYGLKEHELQELLSRAFLVQSECQMERFKEECWQDVNPDNFVSPSSVLLFLRGAQGLLRPNSLDESGEAVMMMIGYKEVVDAIRLRYMSNLGGKKYEKFIHTLLTSYFYRAIDPNIDGNWKTADKRVAASFLYHMVQSCDFDLLSAVLTNLSFIQYCFKKALSKELMEAYQVPVPMNAPLKKEYEASIGSSRFKEYKSFVFRNAHQLSQYPQLTFQQSLLEAEGTSVSADSEEYLSNTLEYRVPYAKWSNKHLFKDLCVQSVDAKRSSCLALSSDERLLAVGFETAVVKLYNTDDFEVTSTLIGHSGCITGLCFVSNFRLCSSSRDETLSLWDISGGYRLAVLEGHRRAVTSCVSDNLGRIVVSVGLDTLINVWHGVTGALETTLPRDIRPINCLSIHPEGQSVVTGSWDSTLKIWDILQKKKKAVLRGHSGSVQEVKFNRSGVHVASVDIFGEVRIWSTDHGITVGILKSPTDDLYNRLFYSPLDAELLTSSSSGTVKVLSSTMGRCINVFTDENHNQATCVTFDSNPMTLMPDVVIGYHSGSVRMYSCTSGDQVWERIQQGPPIAITCLSFLVHGEKKFVVVGKADGTSEVLLTRNGHSVSSLIGHSSPVAGIVCSEDDIITAGDKLINVHKLEGVLKQSSGTSHKPDFTREGHKNLITGIALSPRGDSLASVGRDRALVIWQMDSPMKVRKEFEEAHMDWITCCSWSEQADYLVTGSNDFLVKVWDVNKALLKHVLTGHNSMVTGVSFKYGCIVSSSADGCLKVWSHKGVYLSSLMAPHSKCNSCDLFISLCGDEGDNRTIYNNWDDEVTASKVRGEKSDQKPRTKVIVVASCYDDGTTRIWNPVDADEKHLLVGHKNNVKALTSGHRGLVCTTSVDGLLKAWRIPSTLKGHHMSTEGGNSFSISCLVISPDGMIICAGTAGGSLKLWLRSDIGASMDALSHPKLNVQVSIARVSCLHFISSNLVALTSEDLELSLWQLQYRRSEISLSCLKSVTCDQPITSMASLNALGSSHLVTVHLGGCIQLWRVSSDGGGDIWMEDSKELIGLQFFGLHTPDGDELKSHLFGCKGFGVHRIKVQRNSTLSVGVDEVVTTNFGMFSACDISNATLFCGSTGGLLHVSKGGSGGRRSGSDSLNVGEFEGELDVRIHNDKITGVVSFYNVVVTSSLDGCIKAFDILKRRVIGQLHTPFRITSMIKFSSEAGCNLGLKLLCGTESGMVISVEWLNTNRR